MVKVPCQDIVMNIIPAIQASLAAELVSLGITQVQAAKALSVAPSAVSQYLSGKRGYRIVFEDEILTIIRKLAQDIKDGDLSEENLEKKFCESGTSFCVAHLVEVQKVLECYLKSSNPKSCMSSLNFWSFLAFTIVAKSIYLINTSSKLILLA